MENNNNPWNQYPVLDYTKSYDEICAPLKSEPDPSDARWKAVLFYLWLVPMIYILHAPIAAFFSAVGR